MTQVFPAPHAPDQPAPLIVPPPPATLPPQTPRQQILAKLCDRLEAGFSRHAVPTDKLAAFRNELYLIVIVATHFKLLTQVAEDLIKSAATVGELAAKIADLKGLAADELF